MISDGCDQYIPCLKNRDTLYYKYLHGNFNIFRYRFMGFRYFDRLIILSGKEIKRWKRKHSNISVIPNFLPDIPQVSSSCREKIVLAVGRVTAQKGFLRLLDIWQEVQKDTSLNDWKFCIVGEGDQEKKLRKKICKLQLEDTVIMKPFTREIEKEYLGSSIYALSSAWEAMPMVLLESASYGLPAVSFDINTGPSDIIEDGRSGFLVPDGDIKAFSEKLKVLMKNEDLRKAMGVRAKQIVEERFSEKVILEKWIEILGIPEIS